MKKLILILIAVLFLPVASYAACGTACTKSGTTYTCTDASYDCIAAAVAAASPADTINVTDTTDRTWASNLTITNGVYLTGPGAANLTITKGATSGYMITYNPSNPAANTPFKISGFTFDGNEKLYGGWLNLIDKYPYVQTQIMIMNNTIHNFGPRTSGIPAITSGKYWGVISGNTFTGTEYPMRFTSGPDNVDVWANITGLTYGAENNTMWIEDNTIYGCKNWIDCDSANRYSVRYNNIINTCDTFPLMDQHGDAGTVSACSYQACFGSEMYGNNIDLVQGYTDFRGSKYLIFNNNIASGSFSGFGIRDEYCDCLSACESESATPQYINDSYSFNNRATLTGTLKNFYERGAGFADCQASCGYTININEEYFNQATSPDLAGNGTVGVGCGTLANRPATCTTGVGYWATDQSCTDLTGMVGPDPATPISGTLYKCTSTNTWTAYFTPLTYPHPLTGAIASVSGSLQSDITTESNIVAGGTFTVTASGDTFVDVFTEGIQAALVAGVVGSLSGAGAWNDEVITGAKLSVVRTDANTATFTVAATAGYDISELERVTVTVPDSAMTGGAGMVAYPSLSISTVTPDPDPPAEGAAGTGAQYSSGGAAGQYSSTGQDVKP